MKSGRTCSKRLTTTLVALLGVGALDLVCARMLQSR
jgi:hypothetical protein